MLENVLVLRRYILKYLEVKCHDVFNFISSDSAKSSCCVSISIDTHTQIWSGGEKKTCGKMLKLVALDEFYKGDL